MFGLGSYRKIEKDFPGGLYLPLLGTLPAAEILYPLLPSRLLLPLVQPGMVCSDLSDTPPVGAQYQQDQLIVKQADGYRVYAPISGKTGKIVSVDIHGHNNLPALEYFPDTDKTRHDSEELKAADFSDKDTVFNTIEIMNLFHTRSGQRLAHWLLEQAAESVGTVVANAASLEPEQSLPSALLKNHAPQIFTGLSILKRWLNADKAIMAYPYYFSIDTSPAEQWQVCCAPVTDKYPQGRDSSIIQTLKKQHYIRNHRKQKLDVAVFDLQTLFHVERAFFSQSPGSWRLITICGDAANRPAHYFVPIGTPLSYLLALSEVDNQTEVIVAGSSMTGNRVNREETVIGVVDEAFIALKNKGNFKRHTCIRCGRCIDACPARIDPAALYRLIKEKRFDRATDRRLFDCIECGQCSYVCPSNLPILYKILQAKNRIRSR